MPSSTLSTDEASSKIAHIFGIEKEGEESTIEELTCMAGRKKAIEVGFISCLLDMIRES